MNEMVSDIELAQKVHQLLQTSDLKKTTNNIIIKKLECDYGFDLSTKKPFIRDQVSCFLQTQYEVVEEFDDGSYDPNDDVSSYSDDDDDDNDDDNGVGSHHQQQQLKVPVVENNNDDTSNNSTISNGSFSNSFKDNKPVRQHQEKRKRTCLSGKHCTLSPLLQKFLGVPHMTRAQVVKQLWTYVKEKNLQDPQDGKTIVCDDTLRELLGADSINILQINKALTRHILPQVKSMQRAKPRKQDRKEELFEDGIEEKRPKRTLSGFLAPLPLSETLIKFLGTGETALTRADVIKRIWEYIKDKNLQDPSDKKMVVCDEQLKELFNVDSFHGFFVSKLLSPHLNVMM